MLFNIVITAAEAVADTTSVFKTISVVGYLLAALFFVLSIAIFFLYDIKGAYSYLSGKKQQKGISEMRKHQDDEKNGELPASPSMKFGKADSQKVNGSGSTGIKKHSASTPPPAPPNPVVAPPEQSVSDQSTQSGQEKTDATEMLSNSSESGFDSEGETGVLSPTNISKGSEEKKSENAVSDNENSDLNINSKFGTFILVKNEMVIHTDEIL